MGRARLLFVAENLTLAQVVRLAALARHLDRSRFEVHFACSGFPALVFAGTRFRRWPLHTVDKAESLRKLERGVRLYEASVLRRYVEDELAILEQVRPDLVVGDFRLSLPISCAVARVPCASLINAYWSPFAVRDGFPLPDHPIVDLLGEATATRFFPRAVPTVFDHFAAPVHAVRKHYGLAPHGSLLEVLTAGDYTLYPDIPECCPTEALPAPHRYLGMIPWSPDVPVPAPVARLLEGERPFAYVTLGSSGRIRVLSTVLESLSKLGIAALVATAGRTEATALRAEATALRAEATALRAEVSGSVGSVGWGGDVCVVDYVPGHLACRSAQFVVTNGGSTTGYQALAEGKPVLGIPSNLDQALASAAIDRTGAGLSVRAGAATVPRLTAALERLAGTSTFHERARALSRAFARLDCHQRFAHFVDDALDRRPEHALHA